MSFIDAQMARRLGAAGRVEEAEDRAVTVRPSSTANFYVDSLDKQPNDSSGNFQIVKNNALFNGFFHRIAVGEVVMDWGIPNVASWWGNNFLIVAVDDGTTPLGTVYTVVLDDGFYSAIDALDTIVTKLNNLTAPGFFSIGASGTQVGILCQDPFVVTWSQTQADLIAAIAASSNPGPFPAINTALYSPDYALARALFSTSQLYTGVVAPPIVAPQFNTTWRSMSPLILGTRYVDIVSTQLTYNQDLKDNTTAKYQRDVLYRWYLAWDGNSGVDILSGTPTLYPYYVLQGYKPFNQRRVLPYPKQIRWESKQPIGNVSFQSYDDRGRLIDTSKFSPSASYQFQMSMLLSEN
jgi:hypothetical protein